MRNLFRDFASDLIYGLRQIKQNLSLALICVAVLAIGAGSSTAVFAMLYDALLKPLPYRDAGQLVYVHNDFPGSQRAETAASGPDFRDLSTHHELFSETAAYYFNDFTMTGADRCATRRRRQCFRHPFPRARHSAAARPRVRAGRRS